MYCQINVLSEMFSRFSHKDLLVTRSCSTYPAHNSKCRGTGVRYLTTFITVKLLTLYEVILFSGTEEMCDKHINFSNNIS